MELAHNQDEIGRLALTITTLEAQRAALGDGVVDTTVSALRERLETLRVRTTPQRKQVTVLVADLSGFTAMSERMDPEDVRDTIDSVWRSLDEIIVSWGGQIDQHTGDGVMVFFGIPVAHEDDPERAVAAALALQEALREVNATEEPGQMTQLALRVGVHTGHVLLAPREIGEELVAMGDTVTKASSLEALAPVGSVLISQEVYRHVAGRFVVAPAVTAGRLASERAYIVLRRGLSGPVEERLSDDIRATPMIGRDTQLQLLQEILEQAVASRRARAVTIVGDAGIGKTRLGLEFRQWLKYESRRYTPVTLLEARAELPSQHLPYALVRELLRQFCGILDSDPAVVAREKLVNKLQASLGGQLDEDEALSSAHYIGQLIGFDFRHSPFVQPLLDDARQLRERAYTYAALLLRALARDALLVLLIEDVHWADDGSLDLFWYLMNEINDVPLVVLLLARPSLFERRPTWQELVAPGMIHTLLPLEPLSQSEARELVSAMLSEMPEHPAGLATTIVEAAGGNPYYVEEIVKVLIEDGALARHSAPGALAVPSAELRIPSTLTGVLQTRLDQLAQDERDVLQRAAVVGRVFWNDAVAATGIPYSRRLTEALRQLEARELIFRRPQSTFAGVEEYTFKHAMLREVTYESLLIRQRQAYHAGVAAWLAERSGERGVEYAGLIGSHYELAGETAAAAAWYGRAADRARAAYAAETAIRYYQKALAFTPEDETTLTERVRLYAGLGETLHWQARFAEAVAALQSMLAAAEEIGDLEAQVRAWQALFLAHDYQGEHRASLESARGAERVAWQTGQPSHIAMALSAKGWAMLFLGEEEQALKIGEQARKISEEAGLTRGLAFSYLLLSGAYRMLQQFEASWEATEQALALFRQLGDRMFEGLMLYNLGQTKRLQGEYRAAAAYYEEALELARAVGDHYGVMSNLSRLGRMARLRGVYRQAERYYREALEFAEKSGNVGRQAYLTYSLGDLALAQAMEAAATARKAYLAAAREALYKALQQARESGQAVTEASARVGLARVSLAHGELEAALDEALAGLEGARLQLALWQGVAAEKVMGTAWWVLGQIATRLPAGRLPLVIDHEAFDAAACFAASLAVWDSVGGGVTWERARTLRDWSSLLAARGETARADAMREEATALFARLGMVQEIDRVVSAEP